MLKPGVSTCNAIVLAAHGAGDGSAANLRAVALANRVRTTERFQYVTAAFHRGRPSLLEALSGDHGHTTLVPLATSVGYFYRDVIPHALSRAPASVGSAIAVTPPVGCHAAVKDLALQSLLAETKRAGVDPSRAAVLVVGHGTTRNSSSDLTAIRLVGGLRSAGIFGQVSGAFLSQPPTLESVARSAVGLNLIAYPFLIGGGDHLLHDLPERLLSVRPTAGRGPRTLIAPPLGAHPRLLDLVLNLAETVSLMALAP